MKLRSSHSPRRRRRPVPTIPNVHERLTALETAHQQLRVKLIAAEELIAVGGDAPPRTELLGSELEHRLIEALDLVREALRSRDGDKAALLALYWTVRAALEAAGLRVEFPKTFRAASVKAEVVVPTSEPARHRTIQRVLKPGIIREAGSGPVLLRPAAVELLCFAESGEGRDA